MKNAWNAVMKPFGRAAQATVLVAGLALLGSGCGDGSLFPNVKDEHTRRYVPPSDFGVPSNLTPDISYQGIKADSIPRPDTILQSDSGNTDIKQSESECQSWLLAHPNIANAIKWQNLHEVDAYAPPTESMKLAWQDWSEEQQNDLNQAYLEAIDWFAQSSPKVSPTNSQGLTDHPENLAELMCTTGDCTPMVKVTSEYMWKLYVKHVGFALAVETTKQVPWSIVNYSDEILRYLFDSTTMGWNYGNYTVSDFYYMGTYKPPIHRANNLPKTGFAPPMWTYSSFLKESNLIGSKRIETIGNVLDWMRENMAHVNGIGSYENNEAIWKYRGYPPISKIVHGTVDTRYPHYGLMHWTSGCHRSVGFLYEVLRVVNIPVQPVWACGHELAYFMTEKMYLDHGDNPYNKNVKNSTAPSLSLLIDETTYKSWFTPDITVNILDEHSPACLNIGRRAIEVE
jgi:hypothetical protein